MIIHLSEAALENAPAVEPFKTSSPTVNTSMGLPRNSLTASRQVEAAPSEDLEERVNGVVDEHWMRRYQGHLVDWAPVDWSLQQ
jgi:hypothetical protein